MLFTSDDAPERPGYIKVDRGISIQFDPEYQPEIVWGHIDGPLLHMRNGQLHWLTFWERFQCWIGRADAFSLERKHAPDFVRRWNARVQAERIINAAMERAR